MAESRDLFLAKTRSWVAFKRNCLLVILGRNRNTFKKYSILFCIYFSCIAWWLDNHTLQSGLPCFQYPPGTIVITTLLTVFPLLYFVYLWLFRDYQFPFAFFTCALQPSSPVSSISVFLSCLFFRCTYT